MAKNKRKGIDKVTLKITNSLKNGKIKAKNKKERKNMEAMCCHHKASKKKDKVKPMIVPTDDGDKRICLICGEIVPTKLYEKDEVKKMVAPCRALVSQLKYITVAAGLGDEVQEYAVRMAVDLSHITKAYKKSKSAVERTERVKKHKKKNRNMNEGTFGSWRVNS